MLTKRNLAALAVIVLFQGPVLADYGNPGLEIFNINPDPKTSALGGGMLSGEYSPASVFINPSSPARFYQGQFSLSNSALVQNINQQFAGLVLPSKIGNFTAAAEALSHNNITLNDANGNPFNLNAAQEEAFLLNYAFRLKKSTPVEREVGSIGISAKAINATVGGNSVTATAFDAGCTIGIYEPWGIEAGLALKNIGKSVNYFYNDGDFPTTIDAGFKYQNRSLRNLTGVLGVSHSATDGLDTYSAGASFSPFYPVVLRAGWQQKENSVGTGFRGGMGLNFSNISLNYAVEPFENNTATVQKIGVDIAFGGITDPNVAYDYFLERNFEIARDEYLKGNYISARQKFEEILDIFPSHQPSKDYLAKIAQELEKSEQRNKEIIIKYLLRARIAREEGDLIKSLRLYTMVLGIDPENPQAQEGKAKVEETRNRIEKEILRKQNEKRIIELWSEAQDFYSKSDYVSSKEKINELLTIDQGNIDAKKYLDLVNSKLEKISSVQENEILQKGVTLYNAGKYREALKYFESILLSDPERQDAKNYAENCRSRLTAAEQKEKGEQNLQSLKARQRMDTAFQNALKLYNAQRYKDAIRAFNDAEKLAEEYGFAEYQDNARGYVKKIKNTLSEKSYKEAVVSARNGKLEKSYEQYRKAMDYNPDYSSAKVEQGKVAELLSRKYYEKGTKEFSSGNNAKAKAYFLKSLSYKKDNTEAQRALERIK